MLIKKFGVFQRTNYTWSGYKAGWTPTRAPDVIALLWRYQPMWRGGGFYEHMNTYGGVSESDVNLFLHWQFYLSGTSTETWTSIVCASYENPNINSENGLEFDCHELERKHSNQQGNELRVDKTVVDKNISVCVSLLRYAHATCKPPTYIHV